VITTASEGVGRDRGVAAGIAAEPGSTPWVAASTTPVVGLRVCMRGFSRWQGVFVAAKETVPLPFSTTAVCTRRPAAARPRWCSRPKRGGESYAREKGTKIQSCSRGRHARVLGCTMARGRWVRVATRANANASANGTAWRRGREWHGTANNGDKERLD
jgi:hypothetical protein